LSATWVTVLRPSTKFEVPSPSRSEDMADFRSRLVTLTFDLSISKWGHGSPVSWASVRPIFSLRYHSVLDLGSCIGQTDRQTDGTDRQLSLMHYTPRYGGHNNIARKSRIVG